MTCLSCHDGNIAKGGHMLNQVYETLPATYGPNKPPTLLGNDGGTAGDYLNDHPVGDNAVFGCGGQYNWDCTIAANGTVLMNGPNSSAFVQNYGFFVQTAAWNRHSDRTVHHLPQPAPHERGEGHQRPEHRSAQRLLRHDVLHPCAV